jgi:type IV pilus assembly protein PilQ
MEAFPRIALLGTCVAAGVGIAVCIALSIAEPIAADSISPDSSQAGKTPEALVVPTIDPSALAGGVAARVPSAPAPYEPRIARDHAAEAPHGTEDRVDDPHAQLVANLLDIVKLQATRNQPPPVEPAEDRIAPEPESPDGPLPPPVPTPEPLLLAAPAEDVEEEPAKEVEEEPAEALPEAVSRAPIIEANEGDDHLVVTVQNSDIRDVLELLSKQGNLNILASKSVTGAVSASLSDVDVESALAAILKSTGFIARREGNFIYVGTPEDFLQVDQSLDSIQTRIYRPNYVRAADLNTLITPLLTTGTGKVTVSAPSQIDLPASQTQAGGDSMTGGDVVVVKDYERVLLQIDQLVHEVDCRPRQVLIDAMVLSVKLGDEFKFGINWQVLKDKAHVRLGLGTPPADISGVNFADGGLTFGLVDSTVTNLITFLETIGETNVVASPRLLCLNKQRAEIQIGSSLGYVSTTVTETSSTQAIQFLDVGTLLRLRPHISSDGTIRMEVHPELSTGTVEVQQGLTLPNKEVTQVTTNVMCQNGSTVIIGGLIREDLQNDTDQIPILGSIPVAGALFRDTKQKIDRHEILVLITPRLVDEPTMSQEGAKIANEFLRRQSVVFDKMSPFARRHPGLQYFRKARAAWNAGDAKVALKYANLSIEHDPMNREAIAFRDEVVAAADPHESVHDYLRQGIKLGHHPRKDYSKQGSPWKEDSTFVPGLEPPDTYSPGTPARTLRLTAPPSPPATLNHAKRPTTNIRK